MGITKRDIKVGDSVVLGNRPVYQGHNHYGKTFKEASENGKWESKYPKKRNPFRRLWLRVVKIRPLTVHLAPYLPKEKGRTRPKDYRHKEIYMYWITEYKKREEKTRWK